MPAMTREVAAFVTKEEASEQKKKSGDIRHFGLRVAQEVYCKLGRAWLVERRRMDKLEASHELNCAEFHHKSASIKQFAEFLGGFINAAQKAERNEQPP